MSQTILSPLLGALSDSLGRRAVIFVSLLISASGASGVLCRRLPLCEGVCVCVKGVADRGNGGSGCTGVTSPHRSFGATQPHF
jgi:hypothetical protein